MTTIFQAMNQIMTEVGPISKARRNEKQGYMFRGIDDVYEALQQVMAKHGVFTTSKILSFNSEERSSKSGSAQISRVLHIQYTFYSAVDGSSVTTEVIGEGFDSGDKASNKAMSVAHKYALLQAFCIPTNEAKDPENDSHEVAPKTQPTPPKSPPLYVGSTKQKLHLAGLLKQIGIGAEHYDAISDKLLNRPADQWKTVAEEFQSNA